MTDPIHVGAWLPKHWHRKFTDEERTQIAESDLDLLLVPENHDHWKNRDHWKQTADELDVALYAGFDDGDWIRGIFYDPATDTDFTYTKHSSAGKLALELDDWHPEDALKTTEFRGTTVGTTICHDQYFSPFMGYEGLAGASLLLNVSATPVVAKKWGEVLQARAIENGAYVVCTTHGSGPDGTVKRGNKAHVFAFDPFGDPIILTELGTDGKRDLVETTPDNIYTVSVDPARTSKARQTLTNQYDRPSITRIQDSTSESVSLSEPRVSVQADYNGLRITYESDSIDIGNFESQPFTLADEDFYLAAIESDEILKPERLYQEILSVPDIESKRLLLLNHWSDLAPHYHQNVVEPVLRARCVEWASPAITVAPDHSSAYQVWYAKNTSRMNPDENGHFRLFLYAARGLSSALEPVNHETEKMKQIASACEQRRTGSD
ncbi:carbon-nitrogen hydrolase family protein [Saliphagus infecundisoli]|uniref:Carbon-nitrogen hydrolase family protein n=1 Tax=Saliphagus infecundisoli TaxID=1849069 RepID=A0ABD5QBK4_9EURY|nr:nitrilase-related carbon-nitrogen hydrolase [Saliphagus infecundisoli]